MKTHWGIVSNMAYYPIPMNRIRRMAGGGWTAEQSGAGSSGVSSQKYPCRQDLQVRNL